MSNFVAVDRYAPGRRHIQPSEEIEQSSFAGAARPHERDKVALVHVQIKPLEHLDLLAAAAVRLVQSAHFDEARRISASVHSNHALLLLPDFDFVAIT